MGNSAYLKKYVENHPHNKMAWYLLGKEYEASGQAGKARYCYIQAGNVYEAFESSKIPLPEEVLAGYKEELLQESHRKEKRSRFLRKLSLALLLALLMWIPSAAHAPGDRQAAVPVHAVDAGAGDDADREEASEEPLKPAGDEAGGGAPAGTPAFAEPAFTAIGFAGDPAGTQAAAVSGLLALQRQTATPLLHAAALGMEQAGDWLVWSDDLPVAYGLEQSPAEGRTALQAYDARACECAPPDSAALQQRARQWIPQQESLGVLASAMIHYKQANGAWPASLQDLAGPYPDNWIAGTDSTMEQAFQPLLVQLKRKGVDGATGNADAPEVLAKGMAPGQQPFFAEPYEMIVDTDTHTLAVVSGNVLIRSYPVGLGGSQTPEGTFVISEKVINPNGKDNGEFGSRGMQLSDTNYAIHGTNEPDSIGKDESLGCVRMGKKDVEELFDLVPKGTKVRIGKGILPKLKNVPAERFALGDRQDQTNPHRTYHWLN
ncbi:L,D-transpeptidase [Paenibacillus barengoltzii]|uniref:Lipoprotein-anchoring transpeptidase ErfK/SrfK n=2 Tax=Paenibacillus barengoltzii TaxID=343517 RepID=A0ABY1LW45_9BACL|nr:L,D-transpeptidase [Paenibacillus barengoltzii]SMF17859.1 Lipoprotein-anchoring transpeptidase ErfK/SrfK [Paenibacillus barengoltzii J12]